ncbi:MAG: hypothetical protein A3J28_06835 [Acidobacteria bacterium RIFCSPLOWO2_12_FULL_60_22]|nr:MAG: hypothetical protein A3J28_06835 [Acidobacteria bacterium RIFCSPLOWO2_12_FULL_60_22]
MDLVLSPIGRFCRCSGAGKEPVIRLDPALDSIVPPDAKVEKVAGNFGFLEGPVWVRQRTIMRTGIAGTL